MRTLRQARRNQPDSSGAATGSGEGALVDVFERHVDEVFRFALARTGSRSVADEVTSEVFLAAARRVAARPDDIVEIEWLIGVARNRIIDEWRRRQRDDRRRERAALERPAEPVPSSPDQERVLRALRSLPHRQRACITMRYLDEMGVAEIADQLEVSYRTAESLLARGRRNFRLAFEEGR